MSAPGTVTRTPSGISIAMPDGTPAGKPTARGLKRYVLVVGNPTGVGRFVWASSADLSTLRPHKRRAARHHPVILDRDTGKLV